MNQRMMCSVDCSEADEVTGGNALFWVELGLLAVCAYMGIVDGMAGTNTGESLCH